MENIQNHKTVQEKEKEFTTTKPRKAVPNAEKHSPDSRTKRVMHYAKTTGITSMAYLRKVKITGESKKFWRYIKSQKQDATGVAPLRSAGKLYPDAAGKAQVLARQFSSPRQTRDINTREPQF